MIAEREQLLVLLKKKVESGPQEIDILYWMTRTALELIGQSGMGYSFDSLENDFDYHPYGKSVKKLVYGASYALCFQQSLTTRFSARSGADTLVSS